MTTLCNDVDLLVWEPDLFAGLAATGQTLARQSAASLSNGVLTCAAALFQTAGVQAGCVARVHNADNTIDELLEVVSVTSQTQLALSRLRLTRDGVVLPPFTTASNLECHIVTYQRPMEETAALVLRRCGLEGRLTDIINPEMLRQVVVLGTLADVLSRCATTADQAVYLRAQRYQTIFTRTLETLQLLVDDNGDGQPDHQRHGQTTRLIRQ